ncbi:hypothetical protein WMY93_033413 [Mugilogobius chulae]|uniref:Uncharacterized protein n=1 Tax=Mugilogobius chulae TaxID=88201 RepID=A0AAW0MHA7_9GOBI
MSLNQVLWILVLVLVCTQILHCTVFVERPGALQLLSSTTRRRRANAQLLEEVLPGNLERECYEETCSREEAAEIFQSHEKTMEFWYRYKSVDRCLISPCLNGGLCSLDQGHVSCLCPPQFHGNICENERRQCSYRNGGCLQYCSDLPGGATVQCSCAQGYRLEEDGLSCSATVSFPCGRKQYRVRAPGAGRSLNDDVRIVADFEAPGGSPWTVNQTVSFGSVWDGPDPGQTLTRSWSCFCLCPRSWSRSDSNSSWSCLCPRSDSNLVLVLFLSRSWSRSDSNFGPGPVCVSWSCFVSQVLSGQDSNSGPGLFVFPGPVLFVSLSDFKSGPFSTLTQSWFLFVSRGRLYLVLVLFVSQSLVLFAFPGSWSGGKMGLDSCGDFDLLISNSGRFCRSLFPGNSSRSRHRRHQALLDLDLERRKREKERGERRDNERKERQGERGKREERERKKERKREREKRGERKKGERRTSSKLVRTRGKQVLKVKRFLGSSSIFHGRTLDSDIALIRLPGPVVPLSRSAPDRHVSRTGYLCRGTRVLQRERTFWCCGLRLGNHQFFIGRQFSVLLRKRWELLWLKQRDL